MILFHKYPELNSDSEKFDKTRYDKGNNFMIANSMDIRQAKIAADYIFRLEEADKKVEKAKEEAYVTKKRKEEEVVVEEESVKHLATHSKAHTLKDLLALSNTFLKTSHKLD